MNEIRYETSYPPDDRLCPKNLAESLMRYANDGVPTGDFLHAVLTNDLAEAIGRADYKNVALLPHIVAFCYNRLPSSSWGTVGRVDAWIERGRKEARAGRMPTEKPLGERLRDEGATKGSDVAYLLHANMVKLDQLHYVEADPKGPWRLHLFGIESNADRYTSVWVARDVDPDDNETIPVPVARQLAQDAIESGREVRVTNPADMLVFHAKGGVVYGANFLKEVWS